MNDPRFISLFRKQRQKTNTQALVLSDDSNSMVLETEGKGLSYVKSNNMVKSIY